MMMWVPRKATPQHSPVARYGLLLGQCVGLVVVAKVLTEILR